MYIDDNFNSSCTIIFSFFYTIMFTYIYFILFLIIRINSQVPYFGKCPYVKTMENFQAVKYLGKWYEAERYFALFEFGGKCVTANYELNNKNEINVKNQQISAITGIQSVIEGSVHFLSRTDDAKLSVTFPSLPVNFAAPYWIIDTDYKNYSIVWSCTNFGIISTRNAWILTRLKTPTLDVMEKAYEILDKNLIGRSYFMRTDQTNCPNNY